MGRMRDCGKVFGFHSLFFICKENERNVKKKTTESRKFSVIIQIIRTKDK